MGRVKSALFGCAAALSFFVLLELALMLASYFFVPDSELSLSPQPGKKVILTLGDSFTYGLFVPPTMSYPSQLQKLLEERGCSNIQIVNRGEIGRSPNHMYHTLSKHLSETQPDLLVLLAGFNVNDGDILEFTDTTGSDPSDQKSLGLLRLKVFFSHFRFFRVMDYVFRVYLLPAPSADKEYTYLGMEQFDFYSYQQVNYWALKRLIRAVRSHEVPLIIMNYPQAPVPQNNMTDKEFYYYRFAEQQGLPPLTEKNYLFPSENDQETGINRIISKLSELEDVPLADNMSAVRSRDNQPEYFIAGDEHTNEKGNRVISETLIKKLESLGFLTDC